MLDVQPFDPTQRADASDVPAHERVVEAKRLVQRACRALGTESPEEPFELRLTRALAMNLLDELSILDARSRK